MGQPRKRIDKAFRRLYDAEFTYVLRTLLRLGVEHADAEDLAHDVFLVVFRKRDERDRARPIRPWLFGISHRIVGSYLQKSRRTKEVRDDVDRADGHPGPHELASASEERQLLLDALRALDFEHRVVCVLFDIEGLSAKEISSLLEIPENTVYSRVRNARVKLANAVKARMGGTK